MDQYQKKLYDRLMDPDFQKTMLENFAKRHIENLEATLHGISIEGTKKDSGGVCRQLAYEVLAFYFAGPPTELHQISTKELLEELRIRTENASNNKT